MTATGKWIVGAVIVVLIILAGGLFVMHSHMMGMTASSTAMDGDMSGMDMGSSSDSATLPSGTSTSDASIQQDTSAIDAQMSGLGSDNASVASGMSSSQ